MSSILGLRATLQKRLARPFATKASRFQLAISAGFIVAAVGALTVTVDERSGFADVMWGSMSFFGFGDQPAPQQAASAAPGRATFAHRQHGHPRSARWHGGEVTVHPVRLVVHERAAPVDLARKSVCVRLCDGFAFPVGSYHGDQDRVSHEATCQAECPGAETALYVVPSGSDTIGDAVRVDSGKSYSELPVAFHYTTVLSDACTCHPKAGNRIKSLLHDFTLRRGDAVMTAQGVQVFHGGAHYPFRRNDFVALNESRDIRKGDRATFSAIERASLAGGPIVAQAASTPRISTKAALKTLDHQASLDAAASATP